MGGRYGRSAPPGPVGLDAGATGQLPSWRRRPTWEDLNPRAEFASGIQGNEVHAARIYFSPAEYLLSPDDRKVLSDVAHSLVRSLLDGGEIVVRCVGHADVRGAESRNVDLSRRRAHVVAAFLGKRFQGAPGVRFLPEEGLGERDSSALASQLAEDRRVDVYIRFQSGAELRDKRNPYKQYWANIFKHYYPRYSLWVERGLEYLVDEYERNDTAVIRPEDCDKVLDLISKLAPPSLHQRAVVASTRRKGATQEKDPEEIAAYYEPLYREAWQREAYPRYQRAFLEFFDEHPELPHDEKVRIVSSRSQ